MNKVFRAEQFTPTKWDTAEDKAKFANQFVRFTRSGFERRSFPKWFYRRLSICFGHIAHYNQEGFYHQFFTCLKDTIRFVRRCQNVNGCADPKSTYSDVERALAEWLIQEGVLSQLEKEWHQQVEASERAELARLQAKYAS